MELKQLNINDGIDVYDMLQRIGPDENAFNNEVHGMTYQEYKDWLKRMDGWSKGDMLPDGYVKQWTFWLINDDNVCCGYGKLREKVTEKSKNFGGNIGFAIDPLFRGKGYGKILFAALIEKAKELKINELFSTVEKFNYPSKKVHEDCGGVLVKQTDIRWFYEFDLTDDN